MLSSEARGAVMLAARLLLLAGPILLVLGGVEFEVRKMPTTLSTKKALLDRRAARTDVLVLGNSQAFLGIDPGRLSDSATSAAAHSQSLRCDEAITTLYLGQMGRLRTVVISLSYFSLRYLLEQSEPWREFFYRYYFQVPEETPVRWPWHPRHFLFMANYGGKNTLGLLVYGASRDLGIDRRGWFPSGCGADVLSEAEGAARMAQHTRAMRESAVAGNTRLLDRFIARLRQRGIAVVLATLPVSRTYSVHMDGRIHQELTTVVGGLAARHGASFRDYLTDSRFTRMDFYDYDHLCAAGAQKFTDVLKTELIDRR